MYSMTGFGRAVSDHSTGRLIVEIQSVNRKYSEISVSLPKEFARFEHDIRKWIGEKVTRGQINVRVFFLPNPFAAAESLPSIEVLREVKKGLEKLSKELKLDPKAIDLPLIMQYIPAQKGELAGDEELPLLRKCTEEALASFLKMKQTEGKALAKDLTHRLKSLSKTVGEIEKRAPFATQQMRQKLKNTLEQFFKPSLEIDERILREVALFAEKVDITEEITRFKSHIAQFDEMLYSKEAIGRKMDFLIQEIGREVNTMASKSMDANISQEVVHMKAELEKMREQIQNIE